MENKRLLIAMGLAISFMFFWTLVVVPKITPPPPPPSASASPSATVGTAPAKTSMAPAHSKSETTPFNPEAFLRDAQNEVVFSAQGGAIHNWRLKLKDQDVDLVQYPDEPTLPLSTFPDKMFQIRQTGNQAVMKATVENGVQFTKTLTLNPNGYLHDLTFRFDNPTGAPATMSKWNWGWGPGLHTTPSEKKENNNLIRAISVVVEKARALKPGDYPSCGHWCGVDNRYFLVALIPPADHATPITVTGSKDKATLALNETVQVPARGSTELHYQIYVGPKGYTQLKKYGKGLEAGVDFGTFSALGKLILSAIYRLQGITKNFGWAIVLMTICLQILLLPLTIKSFKATLAMKQIQPKVAELQKKFKGDPKRLNIEMMNLYKNSGTNPFGGCLPMLLQLPIFWALFTALRNAYELRGAPWILWIHDLSVADPYRVLPIIMGAAMFFQQRMAGAVADPAQRQMMMMPIIFTFMFMNFPAGLVLYWLTNNLLTMGFQWGFQRLQSNEVEIIPPR